MRSTLQRKSKKPAPKVRPPKTITPEPNGHGQAVALLDQLPTRPPESLEKPATMSMGSWRKLYRLGLRYIEFSNMFKAMIAMGYSYSTAQTSQTYYRNRLIETGILANVQARKDEIVHMKAVQGLEMLAETAYPPTCQFMYEQKHGKAMQKSHITVEEISVYHPVVDVTPAKSEEPPKQIEEK